MADDTKVTFRAVGWSMTAARDLSRIGDASLEDIKTFAREVSRGNWQLWDILADGERVGCVVWSVENDSDGHALIINAAFARPVRGASVVDEILDTFSALGKRSGAQALRCWTVREGMRRKLEKQGAKRRYVMEIDL